jgi:hypothetical protein
MYDEQYLISFRATGYSPTDIPVPIIPSSRSGCQPAP